MVSRQLFGEQLSEMSGGYIASLEELVAAARAGKEAAAALPDMKETLERQAESHEAMLSTQKKQEEELERIKEERQELRRAMEANNLELGSKIDAAQSATQPMLQAEGYGGGREHGGDGGVGK